MTGQCKHCSHFCTGRIGSVVSLEWSLKLQGCYLGVCWWTHIGIFPWPHPATTGIVSSWTPKGHKNLSSLQLLQFSDVWPGLDVLFCHPCPLQQHGGCSVLPVQKLLKSYLRPCQTKEDLFVAFPALGSTLDIGIGFSILASVSVKKTTFSGIIPAIFGWRSEDRIPQYKWITNGSFRVNCTCTSIDV